MLPLTPSQLLLVLCQPAALWYAAGYGVGVAALYGMARHRHFPVHRLTGLCLVALFGGLIGAGGAQWAVSGNAGKSVLGGVLFGWLAVVVYKRLTGYRQPTGDLFAVALMAGEAIGRLGCFVGGCCYGNPTTLPWATFQHGAFRHPTQIYLSLACAAICGVLLWLDQYRSLPLNGLWAVQGILYCAARFSIEFFRDHNPPGLVRPDAHGTLSTAQWVTLVGFLFFSSYLARLLRKPKEAALVPA